MDISSFVGAFPLSDSITNGIPIHTAACVKVFGPRLVGLPRAETCPVIPETISVGNYSPYSEICISRRKSADLIGIQRANRTVGVIWRSAATERRFIGREHHITHDFPHVNCSRRKSGAAVGVYNLNHNAALQSQRWALTYVMQNNLDTGGRVKLKWNKIVYLNPRPLFVGEVPPQIAPLNNRDNGIDDTSRYSEFFESVLLQKYSFDESPCFFARRASWIAWLSAILGLTSIFCRWRNSRHPVFGGWAVFFGIVLWGYTP